MDKYITNIKLTSKDLSFYFAKKYTLCLEKVKESIIETNKSLITQFSEQMTHHAPLILNIPYKNISGAVGEVFGTILAKNMGCLDKNPHEAGSPDFLPIVSESKPWFDHPTKESFPGGFDTKGCLSRERKFMDAMASSHHVDTKTVLSVLWTPDENNIPQIIGVFYTNSLDKNDWKMSHSRSGSKTTSAASLRSSGKDKLRSGWLVIRDDTKISKIAREKYGVS